MMWNQDDYEEQENLRRQDHQTLSDEFLATFAVKFAVTWTVIGILSGVIATFVLTGFVVFVLPLVAWLVLKIRTRYELYRFHRQIASEISYESPLSGR